METPRIRSIVEAFSMQPAVFEVMENNTNFYDKDRALKEIKLEYIEGVYDNQYVEYYVGYNFEGKKIFQYLAKSVNVHYFVD